MVGSLKGLNFSDLRSNPGKNGNPTRHETTSFKVSLISHDITSLSMILSIFRFRLCLPIFFGESIPWLKRNARIAAEKGPLP